MIAGISSKDIIFAKRRDGKPSRFFLKILFRRITSKYFSENLLTKISICDIIYMQSNKTIFFKREVKRNVLQNETP